MRVVAPTSTPATSVIAFNGPGVPSKGTPKSRARTNAEFCADARQTHSRKKAREIRKRLQRITQSTSGLGKSLGWLRDGSPSALNANGDRSEEHTSELQ